MIADDRPSHPPAVGHRIRRSSHSDEVGMAEVLELLEAALAGRYSIQRELGQGGMATVYLAQDLKHHRHVALKVLRPELSAVLGAERFLKEVEVTANLQHPHLLPLFDSGEANGLLYYVMPYVEGESLRAKLKREKQLPVEEAVRIVTHVASALEYAHRHGVIHRDVKPENILLHDDQVQIADFGIALALRRAGGERLTETGLSLGTPQYMSPEQAMGEQTVDHRVDIYALGAVLYELLTGEPPFDGATVQAVLTKVMTAEPARVTGIRKSVPANVAAAVHKALQKVPADRFGSADEFARALATTEWLRTGGQTWEGPASSAPAWRRKSTVVLALLAVPLAVSTAFLGLNRPARDGTPTVHAIIETGWPQTDQLDQFRYFNISPDGRLVAYLSGRRLALRPLGSDSVIRHIDGYYPILPVFSPDGAQLAYIDNEGDLFRVPVAGGARTEIARFGVSEFCWGEDNNIYYPAELGGAGLWRVPVRGGKAEQVTRVRVRDGERAHTLPQLLPGGKALLYTALGPSGGSADSRVVAQRLDSRDPVVLVENAEFGRYLPSGHLLYARNNGTLYAVRFDPERLRTSGDPAAVQEGVGTAAQLGQAFVTYSANGVELFLPRHARPSYRFFLVDRSTGRRTLAVDTAVMARAGWLSHRAALSPDGKRIALSGLGPGTADIWILADSSTAERVTLDPAEDERPAWSPDGRSIAYASAEGRVFVKDVSSTSPARLVRNWSRHAHVSSWSPDGKWLLLEDQDDVWAIALEGRDSVAVAVSPANERSGVMSPDGRWVAYTASVNDKAKDEIFVASFPDTLARRQLTTSKEMVGQVRWHSGGRELYYIRDYWMRVLPVDLAGGFRPGVEDSLFPSFNAQLFDVSQDGQRFLLRNQNIQPDWPRLHVRTHWFDDIRAKVK